MSKTIENLLAALERQQTASFARAELSEEEVVADLKRVGVLHPRPARFLRCPECGQTHAVDADPDSGLALFCPEAGAPLAVDTGQDEVLAVDVDDFIAAFALANRLAPLRTHVDDTIRAVGVCERRGLRVPVYWAPRLSESWVVTLRGVRASLADRGVIKNDGHVIVLSPTLDLGAEVRRGLAAEGIVHVTVVQHLVQGLRLDWRAVFDVLDPSYWKNRHKNDEFVYEDVTLDLAESEDRHVARFNGREHPGFARSDVKFARLLRIAAARVVATLDAYGGGWIETNKVGIKGPQNRELDDLRAALAKEAVAGLPNDEPPHLLRTRRGHGVVRLALLPNNVRIDPSVVKFKPLESVRLARLKGKVAATRGRAEGASSQIGRTAKGIDVAHDLVRDALSVLSRAGLLSR